MTGMHKKLLTAGVVLTLAAMPTVASAVGGLSGPVFGIDTAPNGDLLVADFTTGVIPVADDLAGEPIEHFGATDVSPIGRSSMWVVNGAAGDPTMDSGQALYRVSNGKTRQIVNLYEFEATVNPDGNDPFDSNPFDVQALGGDAALVVDAGGNSLLNVDSEGNVEVMAVFHDEVVSTENIKALAGCPPEGSGEFPCFLPPAMPSQPVPTSIAIGADGWIYVGELAGFPAPTNESDVWRVAPDASWAQCDGTDPDCQLVFDGGFTSIIDLAFGPDGNLYVAELDEGSWAAVEIFGDASAGGTVNSCDLASLSCSEVATGQTILTSITFGKDGTMWAARNALIPGGVEVVALP